MNFIETLLDSDSAQAVFSSIPTIIAALTVAGILFQLWAAIEYKRECSDAKKLENFLKVKLSAGQGHVVLHPDEILKQIGVRKDGIVGTRVREVEAFSDYAGMVALHDLGAVASENDAGKFRNAFPSTLIASLLVLGLLGTLWSLRDTLSSEDLSEFVQKSGSVREVDEGIVAPDDGEQNAMTAAAFQQALGDVVKGFGHAFFASICGVLGTIILIIVRTWVRVEREKCFNEIESLAVRGLLPYYIEPEQSVLKRAHDNIERGAKKYRESSEVLERQADKITEAGNSMALAVQEISRIFGDNGKVVNHIDQFTEIAKKFAQDSSAAAEAQESMAQANKEVVEECKEMVSEIKSYAGSLQKQSKQQNEDIKATLGGISSAFNQNAAELKKELTNLRDSVSKNVENMRSTVNTQIHRVSQMLDVFSTSLNEAVAELKDTHETHAKDMIGGVKNVGDAVMKLDGHIVQLPKMLDDFGSDISEALQDLRLSLQQQPEIIAKEIGIVIKEAEGSVKKLGELSEKMAGRTKEIGDEAKKMSENVTSATENFSAASITITHSVAKLENGVTDLKNAAHNLSVEVGKLRPIPSNEKTPAPQPEPVPVEPEVPAQPYQPDVSIPAHWEEAEPDQSSERPEASEPPQRKRGIFGFLRQ